MRRLPAAAREGGEGANGKADVELAAGETLFVEGENDATIDDESGAGVVAVPKRR